MRDVYAGIDIGSDSIKIVVALKNKNKFHVLASVSSKSLGIRDGEIVDTREAVYSVRTALDEINNLIGFKLKKVILAVAPINCNMEIMDGSCDIDGDVITGFDISNAISDSVKGHTDDNYELVTAIPIVFNIDDKDNIKNPKGLSGDELGVKCVVSSVPKEPLYRVLEVLKLSGLEVIDIAYTSTGDYYSIMSSDTKSTVGAIINIGLYSTNIAVFNKGIQIKNSILPVGSYNVDKDISYIFKIDLDQARNIKENFAVSTLDYADPNDLVEIELEDGTIKEISQTSVSKVVNARCDEILQLAKNEIKNLTNRKISYIIVTGGLSELNGFSYLVEDVLGINAKVCNMNIIGVRHNKFSSVLGIIKYYDEKIDFRDIKANLVSEEEVKDMTALNSKNTSDNILGKMFGHFFDN